MHVIVYLQVHQCIYMGLQTSLLNVNDNTPLNMKLYILIVRSSNQRIQL